MSDRTRTVFLGTGAFAVPIVEALAQHPSVELNAVVTAPPRAADRGKAADPPVAKWATEHEIKLLRPARLRSAEAVAEIASLRPELLVLADYGQIVPSVLLDLPRHGALNLHPSLLPRHRGATPIPAAILAGDAETGVTLMRMDAGLDSGPIVAQWHTALNGDETAPELEAALADQAARLLTATLKHWLTGEIEPDPQAEKQATLTRPLVREDGRLDPQKPATELERQVRAYQPWPGSFLDTELGRLVVWRAHPAEEEVSHVRVGQLAPIERGLALATSDGLLALDEVQPAAGRRMTGADLLRGRPGFVGQSAIASEHEGNA